jgi:hypothetical protein
MLARQMWPSTVRTITTRRYQHGDFSLALGAHTAVPVIAMSRLSGVVPRMPLFFPINSHRDATRLPSAFWKNSTTSRCSSSTLATGNDDEVVDYKTVHCRRIVGVPHFVPERVNDDY